ncbi:G-protein coupled receptor 83-like [Saccostrea echinata]|uniref:G-protein coupled receptor 83-like n=1 Tax=Saccostrea echinata TaxID=191078 RepID=UPI002A7FA62B|nr:G-protein coupled receptor 83-like [Saccostrea echinata]
MEQNASENITNKEEYDIYDSMYYEDIDSLKQSWTVKDGHFLPTILVYGLTFVIGLTGNILVIYAVVCSRKMRSITASFMISLATADILFLVVCVPYNTVEFVKIEWQLGPGLCKLSVFTELLSAFSSILNLSAVSVER